MLKLFVVRIQYEKDILNSRLIGTGNPLTTYYKIRSNVFLENIILTADCVICGYLYKERQIFDTLYISN